MQGIHYWSSIKFASIYYYSTLVNKRIYHTQINMVNGLLSSAAIKSFHRAT